MNLYVKLLSEEHDKIPIFFSGEMIPQLKSRQEKKSGGQENQAQGGGQGGGKKNKKKK